MNKTIRDKRDRRGFTLAELLVVIAITGVLAAFGFVQVSQYQKKLKRTEMDNTAAAVFTAAQNHLTASYTGGSWSAGFYNGSDVSIDTDPDWQGNVDYTFSDAQTDEDDTTVHAYSYVIYNSGDDQASLTDPKSALTQMLPFGAVDETIRTEGSYIIEFDAATGTVYGVFYTDKGSFSAEDLAALNSSSPNYRTDAKAREQYGSSKCAIGYYGGAAAIKNTVENALSAPTIEINNGDVLEAVITDPNFNTSLNDQSVHKTKLKVTITQNTPNEENSPSSVFVIDLTSRVSEVTRSGNYALNDNTVIPDVSAVSNFKTSYARKAGWYTTYTEGVGLQYHIILDDITGSNTHFNDLFTTITPGANIHISAEVIDTNATVGSVSSDSVPNSANTNSIFANAEESSSGKYCAEITNARHLANLSQNISGYQSENGFTLQDAKLTSDIDWSSWIGSSNVTYIGNSKVVDNSRFLSIVNTDLKTFKGNGHTLSNFYLLSIGQGSGLFSSVSKFTVSDLDLVNFKAYSSNKAAGALIGTAGTDTNVTNVHVYCTDRDQYGSSDDQCNIVSSKSYAGGLIGEVKGNTNIKESSASVKTGKAQNGTDMVSGGLVGGVSGGTLYVDQCYVGGMVEEDSGTYDISSEDKANISADTDAGGFIGRINSGAAAVVQNSYTTASVYGVNNAGGFVGSVNGTLQVKNIYAAGSVGGSSAGALIGQISGSVSVTSGYAYALDGVSNLNSIGLVSNSSVNGMSLITSDDLTKLGTGTASPYTTSKLTTSYPYPTVSVSSSSYVHHGDWVVMEQESSLVKNIYLYSNKQSWSDELSFIRQRVHFVVTGSRGYRKTYDLSDPAFTCTETSNGYTCRMNIELNENDEYYYRVQETSSWTEYQELTDAFRSYDNYDYDYLNMGRYFDTYNTVHAIGTLMGYDYDYTVTGDYRLSTNYFVVYSQQKTVITFNNAYVQKTYGVGLLYYEKYVTNSRASYQYHGYRDDGTEIGNANYPTSVNTNVSEDGYVLTIDEKYFKNGKSGYEQFYVQFGYNSYGTVKLSKLISDGVITELSSATAQAMGLGGNKVFKLNLDTASIRKGAYYSGDAAVNIEYKNDGTITGFYMNPYFADSVEMTKDENSDHLIRTASQWDRIIQDDGWNVFNVSNQSGTIHQQLDIDLSSYYTKALASGNTSYFISNVYANGNTVTYQGDQVTLSDGSKRNAKLTVKNTLFKYIHTSGTVQDLTVCVNVDSSASGSQIQAASDGSNYGAFVSKAEGTLKNIDFVDSSISGVNLSGAYGSFGSAGFIGFVNSSAVVQNISFTNTTVQNVTVNATRFGLIGYADAPLSSISADGTVWKSCTLNTGSAGLIGSMNSNDPLTGITLTNTTWNDLTLNGSSFGLIGSVPNSSEGGALNQITFDGVDWKSIRGTAGRLGLIGTIGNGNDIDRDGAAAMVIHDVNWEDVQVTSDHVGLFGSFLSNSYGMSISDVTWNRVNITPASANWQSGSLATWADPSSTCLIPMVYQGKVLNNTTISNITMTNLNTSAAVIGIVGSVGGTVNDLKVSEVTIKNQTDKQLKIDPVIKGQSCGVIAYIGSAGVINGLSVTKGDSTGLTMSDLNMDTKYAGVIGLNQGTINGYADAYSLIDGVSIDWMDCAGAIAALNVNDTYAYGVIGMNSGAVNQMDIQNVRAAKAELPGGDTSHQVYLGIVGKNTGSLADMTMTNIKIDQITEHVSGSQDPAKVGIIAFNNNGIIQSLTAENIQLTNISTLNTDTNVSASVQNYAFISVNEGSNAERMIQNITINGYISDGYGFVYQNTGVHGKNNGKIDHVAVTGYSTSLASFSKAVFAGINTGTITNCSVTTDAAKSGTPVFYEDSTNGIIIDCALNGTAVNVS